MKGISVGKQSEDSQMTQKKCTQCGEIKSLSNFCKHSTCKAGVRPICRECKRIALAKWRMENRAKSREIDRKWREKNIEKVRMSRNKCIAKKRATLAGTLNHRISVGMQQSLKGNKKGRSWESLVGFSLEELKKHLEKQFKKGMSWELVMTGQIHIDHKIPIAAFNYDSPEDIDFKRCWALKNLQPLFALENKTKKDSLYRPFQPALLLQAAQTEGR